MIKQSLYSRQRSRYIQPTDSWIEYYSDEYNMLSSVKASIISQVSVVTNPDTLEYRISAWTTYDKDEFAYTLVPDTPDYTYVMQEYTKIKYCIAHKLDYAVSRKGLNI